MTDKNDSSLLDSNPVETFTIVSDGKVSINAPAIEFAHAAARSSYDQGMQHILVLTERMYDFSPTMKVSGNTTVHIYNVHNVNIRALRGMQWSALILVGSAEYRLNSYPHIKEAIEEGCRTNNVFPVRV